MLIRRVLICLTIVALLAISISVGVITADWPRWSRELGLPGPEPAGNPRPSAG